MLLSRLSRQCYPKLKSGLVARPYTVSFRLLEKPLPPRRTISEEEITESFLKGTGPGGQKINKTSSAVQIKHLPTGIVVKSQGTRSREHNRKVARQILAEKLEEIEKGDKSRTAIKAERARTKKASANKKSKRKYRKLEQEKGDGESGGNAEEGTNGSESNSANPVDDGMDKNSEMNEQKP